MQYLEKILQSAAYIQEKLGKIQAGAVGLITGTGLGGLAGAVEKARALSYADIPGFPVSTVPSHPGRLIAGELEGAPVVVLNGRFHLYEGFDAGQVVHGVRVLGELGVRTLVLTNAAGALDPGFAVGAPMLIEDHINLTGTTPLRGPNHDRWGERFPDMRAVYDPGLRELAVRKALDLSIRLERGVYMQVMGPNMETPAETRMYRAMGADAIGMSTCVEAIAAHHMGMRLLAFSCLTNRNLPDCMAEASLDAVIAAAEAASGTMTALLRAILKEIGEVTE